MIDSAYEDEDQQYWQQLAGSQQEHEEYTADADYDYSREEEE